MPITKDTSNVIEYIVKRDLWDSDTTGVFSASDFAVSSDADPTQQIQFDPSLLPDNTAVVIKANASTAGNITVTLPSTSGTLSVVGAGAVTSISVATANGFSGSSSGGSTPILTLATSVSGVLKGNGTTLSAAVSGTDYSAGTSALATGILKSTTSTGGLTIAAAGDFPTLNQNTSGTAAGLSATLVISSGGTGATSTSQNFAFIGPVSGSGAPSFRAIVAGDIPSLTSTYASTSLNNLTTTNINQDLKPGSDAGASLGTSAANWAAVATYAVNATNGTKAIELNSASGRALNAGSTRNMSWGLSSSATAPGIKFDQATTNGFVKTSSSDGTLSIDSTTYLSGTVALGSGGTGQTTKAAAFDALQPMTTGGDLIYGGASGTGTRLANGSAGQLLTSAGGTSAPTWATPSRTINAQSGTTYTFVLADGSGAGSQPLVTFGSASATTVTVPTNASVAFPIGTQIDCIQQGAGKVTFAAAGGVTINSKATNLSISAQYVSATLIKTATNVWTLIGDLIA